MMPIAPKQFNGRKPTASGIKRETRTSSCRRGYNYKWQQESAKFLRENTVCVYCGQAKATCVDHAIAHKGDQLIFWDRSNWMASCIPCNSRKAVIEEGALGRGSVKV